MSVFILVWFLVDWCISSLQISDLQQANSETDGSANGSRDPLSSCCCHDLKFLSVKAGLMVLLQKRISFQVDWFPPPIYIYISIHTHNTYIKRIFYIGPVYIFNVNFNKRALRSKLWVWVPQRSWKEDLCSHKYWFWWLLKFYLEGLLKKFFDSFMHRVGCFYPPLAFHFPLPLLLKPSFEGLFFRGSKMVKMSGSSLICIGCDYIW